MSKKKYEYSEDLFADTRMSFGDHIEELRTHLLRAIYGFLIALVFSFLIGSYVLDIIKAPVESQLKQFDLKRTEKVKEKLDDKDPELLALNQPIDVPLSVDGKELAQQ